MVISRQPSPEIDTLPTSPQPDLVLDGLAVVARAVAIAPDLPAIYRALYQFAKSVSSTSGIFVSLYDPQQHQRVCVFAGGDDGEDDVSSLPSMPMNHSPLSLAMSTAEPVITHDLQSAHAGLPIVTLGGAADPRPPQSSLAVPMSVLGRVIGALEVQSVEAYAYREAHVGALQMAANIAALSIEQVRRAEPKGRRLTSLRKAMRTIIDDRTFTSVFQPIVGLDSRAIVGYEALTRFDDGTPPDVRFRQAGEVGLGLELEAATLESACEASERLPANVWLNLNVSPELVLAGEPLGAILRRWAWQFVLEVTEHVAVDDYDALRDAIQRLGGDVRLAVDDAGAGFASFRHILELGPDFVKLDRAIVSGIDSDPARQAFVAGMRHFAVTTGCILIAEGIETEAELGALCTLGVTLGQGYYLGRPAPAGAGTLGAN